MGFIRDINQQTSRQLLAGLKILVVEDELDARELVAAVLKSYGAEIKEASSAAQGLEALQQWHPDLMVSDIGMP
jgi:CheY-like chemotaxis protein